MKALALVLLCIAASSLARGQSEYTLPPGYQSNPTEPPAKMSSEAIKENEDFARSHRFNVHAALYMLNSNWNMGVDYAVSDRWTVGPVFTYYSIARETSTTFGSNPTFTDKTKAELDAPALGLRANWYATSRIENSFVVTPYANFLFAHVSGEHNETHVDGDINGGEVGLTLTYQFVHKKRLNVALGGGIGGMLGLPTAISNSETDLSVPRDIFNSGYDLHLDTSIGYVF